MKEILQATKLIKNILKFKNKWKVNQYQKLKEKFRQFNE